MKKTVKIIMNGVTGRMGTNQHLLRSIAAIREDGGVALSNGDRLIPEPILVGRNPDKLAVLADRIGGAVTSTDLDAVLADPENEIYFDSQRTDLRPAGLRKAFAAKKAVYTEKPIALSLEESVDLAKEADAAGVKHGVVQDKLWLPGLVKLKSLIDSGFFGRILAVRGEFGYWVFDGKEYPAQRPSWNYKTAEGGGILMDMYAHWRYVLDNLFGNVTALSATAAVHLPERVDEAGKPYDADAEDAAYGTFETDRGIICHFASSWCVRVRRDDLLTIHVDGTGGSAVAGLRECWIQPASSTPKPVWNPDIEQPIDFFQGWQKLPNRDPYPNAFRAQWELFLKYWAEGGDWRWGLMEGAKGVQLADLAFTSWRERRWVDVPKLG